MQQTYNQQWTQQPQQQYYNTGPISYNPNYQMVPTQQTYNQPINQTSQGSDKAQYSQSPYKYPTQIGCVKRDDINLYVNVSLNPPSEQDLKEGIYPGLDVFGRSRFDVFIFKYECSI